MYIKLHLNSLLYLLYIMTKKEKRLGKEAKKSLLLSRPFSIGSDIFSFMALFNSLYLIPSIYRITSRK